MDVVFVLDIPTICGLIALVGVILVAVFQRVSVEMAMVIALICVGLIFAN